MILVWVRPEQVRTMVLRPALIPLCYAMDTECCVVRNYRQFLSEERPTTGIIGPRTYHHLDPVIPVWVRPEQLRSMVLSAAQGPLCYAVDTERPVVLKRNY